MPAGVSDGHFLLALIHVSGGSSAVVTPPAGWTLYQRTNEGTTRAALIYYKVASSEPASYTWTFGSSLFRTGGIMAFSGVDTGNPFVRTVLR